MEKSFDSIKYESRNLIKNFLINKFKNEVLSLVKFTGVKSILDVGCGEGYLLSFLNSRIRDWHVTGFDIDGESVSKAKQKVPLAHISIRDIYNCGYPDETFDLVSSNEVLEHLEYPEKALNEISRVTKKWVILSVPNEPFFALSTLLAGKNILRLGIHKEHCNNWSASAFINLVSRYFSVSRVLKPFPWTIVLCEKLNKDTPLL